MKCFVLILAILIMGFALEQPRASCAPSVLTQLTIQDSIRQAQAIEKRRIADSIQHVRDSLAMQYIGLPDPNRANLFTDSLRKQVIVENGDIMTWLTFAKSLEAQIQLNEKASRERWVIAVIGLLLLFIGIVNAAFPNEVSSIIQAFYNDRMLMQINKEDTLYSSWPFVFLYILFGFATGLFIYQCNLYYIGNKATNGPETFLGIAFFVMLLFALKIVATRFLGFVFDIQRVVREYVSILYLSYFNAALVFLPIILTLSLIPQDHIRWVIPLAFFVVLCLFVFRFAKTASNVFINHRFSKFYLFMYLCCLEIAPVLILIKVLGN